MKGGVSSSFWEVQCCHQRSCLLRGHPDIILPTPPWGQLPSVHALLLLTWVCKQRLRLIKSPGGSWMWDASPGFPSRWFLPIACLPAWTWAPSPGLPSSSPAPLCAQEELLWLRSGLLKWSVSLSKYLMTVTIKNKDLLCSQKQRDGDAGPAGCFLGGLVDACLRQVLCVLAPSCGHVWGDLWRPSEVVILVRSLTCPHEFLCTLLARTEITGRGGVLIMI